MNFTDMVQKEYGTRNWVLARRTKNILARYGTDVVTLSKKQYRELEADLEFMQAPNHPAHAALVRFLESTTLATGLIRNLRAEGFTIERIIGGK